jgi:hypothetical protein
VTKVTLQRGLAIAVTLALLLLVFELVRRKRLSERYAILWLLAATTLFVLAAWKGLLTTLSHDVGISYPPSALFAVAIGLIAMILLHFSLAVSRLSDQNKILAQRLALLQQRVDAGAEEPLRRGPPRSGDPGDGSHAEGSVEQDAGLLAAEELSSRR